MTMRCPFFVATEQGTGGAILASVANLFKLQPQDAAGNPVGHPRLVYTPQGDASRAVEMLLLRIETASPLVRGGKTWTVWLLVPVSTDWSMGPRAMRKIVRARFGTDVLGPYYYPELLRADAAAAALIAPNGVPRRVVAGDDPVAQAAIDYVPSLADADADTEPDPAAIGVPT